ncbi:uncharacterized protein LOC5567174 [Aedes aegypti]|uniref:Uncharacterized protein n=1 Tax=Aedes aegypti TaxID=7159 RepID=A0A6I8TUI2_AEDAE|nr:uncharacterized protein LOC110679681 [Aedes aegypti]XP_021712658.1 uncharacterized protein LOC5567174 [Aedes aegypti]
MLLRLTILACLAISSATAEPHLEHAAAYGYGAHLFGGINPELYTSARAMAPVQYASSVPMVYANQLMASPLHRAIKPAVVSAPLQYAASLPPLLYNPDTQPFWDPPLQPHHHHSITPLLSPTLKLTEQVLPTHSFSDSISSSSSSNSIINSHTIPFNNNFFTSSSSNSNPISNSWTPLLGGLPLSSTVEEYHLHIPVSKWRPAVRARRLLAKWPFNFLRVTTNNRRHRLTGTHARKLGQIVSRIRWLEKYLHVVHFRRRH